MILFFLLCLAFFAFLRRSLENESDSNGSISLEEGNIVDLRRNSLGSKMEIIFAEWHMKHGERQKASEERRKASHQANILNFIVMITLNMKIGEFPSCHSLSSTHPGPHRRRVWAWGESGKIKLLMAANNQLLISSSWESLLVK